MKPESVLVAYVASPHEGYLQFFRSYHGGRLYILGEEFTEQFTSLTRHLPGNKPDDAHRMIKSLGIFSEVSVLTHENLAEVKKHSQLVMPDEDVSHAFAKKYFAGQKVRFDGRWRLRWDWKTTTHKKDPRADQTITSSALHRELMGRAFEAADRSPDWWRQIGALLARGGKSLLVAFNTHLPSEQMAYLCGDPRSNFDPGEHIDASLALHAEMGIITEAARRGISTTGCDMYTTTFPCPPCANALANSGIRRLYYAQGYSLVAGADSLRRCGVEIVRVDMQSALAPA